MVGSVTIRYSIRQNELEMLGVLKPPKDEGESSRKRRREAEGNVITKDTFQMRFGQMKQAAWLSQLTLPVQGSAASAKSADTAQPEPPASVGRAAQVGSVRGVYTP